MRNFKDFLPNLLISPGPFKDDTFESLEQVMSRINLWENDNSQIKITQVETVILPGVRDRKTDVNEMRIMEGGSITWIQFFRVWYTVKD